MYQVSLVFQSNNLSFEDLDFKRVMFIFSRQNSKDSIYRLMTRPDWCNRWLDIRPESDYFFCTLRGGKLSDRYLREVCYRISEKAGVYINDNHRKKRVSPHVLRHTCATELLEEGFNIREVQQVLGHENLNTTMIYTAVRPESLALKMKQRGLARCGQKQ